MSSSSPDSGSAPTVTVVCLASYFKGTDFMQECRRQGCRVLLITSQSLEHAAWPRESIDEFFYVPDVDKTWNINDVCSGSATSPRRRTSTASWRSTTSTWRRRRSCASICACPAWARPPRATSATSWPCVPGRPG